MNYEKLFINLNYHFNNISILERALRHRSLGKISNERLEFLGDSALNFTIAVELYHRYPNMTEGELSRLRANLVNGEVLAELAVALGVGDFLQFGAGELRSGGMKRKSILTDAMEAIIGAIYLDSDFTTAQKSILHWFKKIINNIAGVVKKDPKTTLQEFLQKLKLPLPIYTVESISGASHSQIFTVKCAVCNLTEATISTGPNKRQAESFAAAQMLTKIASTIIPRLARGLTPRDDKV